MSVVAIVAAAAVGAGASFAATPDGAVFTQRDRGSLRFMETRFATGDARELLSVPLNADERGVLVHLAASGRRVAAVVTTEKDRTYSHRTGVVGGTLDRLRLTRPLRTYTPRERRPVTVQLDGTTSVLTLGRPAYLPSQYVVERPGRQPRRPRAFNRFAFADFAGPRAAVYAKRGVEVVRWRSRESVHTVRTKQLETFDLHRDGRLAVVDDRRLRLFDRDGRERLRRAHFPPVTNAVWAGRALVVATTGGRLLRKAPRGFVVLTVGGEVRDPRYVLPRLSTTGGGRVVWYRDGRLRSLVAR